jgi:hypothetical protein
MQKGQKRQRQQPTGGKRSTRASGANQPTAVVNLDESCDESFEYDDENDPDFECSVSQIAATQNDGAPAEVGAPADSAKERKSVSSILRVCAARVEKVEEQNSALHQRYEEVQVMLAEYEAKHAQDAKELAESEAKRAQYAKELAELQEKLQTVSAKKAIQAFLLHYKDEPPTFKEETDKNVRDFLTRLLIQNVKPMMGMNDTMFPAPKLKVVRIERMLNYESIKAHVRFCKNLRKKHKNQPVDWLDSVLHSKDHSFETNPEEIMNEYLVFHGTSEANTLSFLLRGIDRLEFGGANGSLFGKAWYCALLASKADRYATPNDSNGEKCMLVCKVCAGKAYHATDGLWSVSHPPNDPDTNYTTRFDSVVGLTEDQGGRVLHNEIAVTGEGQGVPLFRITYKHERGCECRECQQA